MRIAAASTAGVRRADVVLASAILAASVAQVLWLQPLTDEPALDLVVTGASVVPLIWRRTHPVAAAAAGSAAWVVPTEAFLLLGYVVAILLFYSVGRWTSRGRVVGVAVCAFANVTGTVGTLLGQEEPVTGLLTLWLVVLAPYGFGLLVRSQERETAARLIREREATRVRAVEDERARIVRELHDVVGHEVTLMSIQSEAAAQALAKAPERAAEPVAAMRETAHRASRQLRTILNLLGERELAVAADHRGLQELVDRAARLGIPATMTETGEPWTDAPSHWLAINRIVQECLTNAGKHAPGQAVMVRLAWAADAVWLEVSNDAPDEPAAGNGLGFPGMAERARLLGGHFETSYDVGRFTVTARLPAPEETRS